MNSKPHVISISAVSGGGKTTITNQMKASLPNSKSLFFDDYQFEDSPEDICEWVKRGADYNEWILTPMIKDVQLHVNEKSARYILLDYPFAYLNEAMSEYIDFTIFIDTPLDIAMARRIQRDYTEKSINDLKSDLSNYLSQGRDAYIEMQKSIKPNSDLIIDGSMTISLITNQILKEIKLKL